VKKAAPISSRSRAGAKAARAHAKPAANVGTLTDFDERPLHRCVEDAMNAYFAALDGEDTSGLFDLVMTEVERPMFECVMRYVGGNQCRAAAMLGVSRGTLRKKLTRYGLLDR